MMESKLSKEKIVQADFDLLAETPELSNLSLRKVAKKLFIQVPAIYWYFESKQALLQCMSKEIDIHFCSPKSSEEW